MGLYNLFVIAIFLIPVIFYLARRERKSLSDRNISKILLLVVLIALTLFSNDGGFESVIYLIVLIFAIPILLIFHWILWIVHGFRQKGVSLAAELFLPVELLLLMIFLKNYMLAALFIAYLVFLIIAHIQEKRQ